MTKKRPQRRCGVCGVAFADKGGVCDTCKAAQRTIVAAVQCIRHLEELEASKVAYVNHVVDAILANSATQEGLEPLQTLTVEEAGRLLDRAVAAIQNEISSEPTEYVVAVAYGLLEQAYGWLESGERTVVTANGEIAVASLLAEIALDEKYVTWRGTPGLEAVAVALELGRRLQCGLNNLQHMMRFDVKCTPDNFFHELQETPELTAYYESVFRWIEAGRHDDYAVEDQSLERYFQANRLSEQAISDDLGEQLRDSLGFSILDLFKALRIVFDEDLFLPGGVVPLPRRAVLLAMAESGLDERAAKKLLEHFTVRAMDREQRPLLHRTIWQLQRKAYLPIGAGIGYGGPVYLLGRQVAVASLTAFQEVLELNTFLDRVVPGGATPELRKATEVAQQRRSKRFELLVADVWRRAGMVLPMDRQIPHTGIDKIRTGGGVARLVEAGRSLGDLDVIALDATTSTLLIGECKCFGRRPLTPLEFSADVERIEQDVDKIRARHRWVMEHLDDVCMFIGAPRGAATRVKTVLVTAAPSFAAVKLASDAEITAMDFRQFLSAFLGTH